MGTLKHDIPRQGTYLVEKVNGKTRLSDLGLSGFLIYFLKTEKVFVSLNLYKIRPREN